MSDSEHVLAFTVVGRAFSAECRRAARFAWGDGLATAPPRQQVIQSQRRDLTLSQRRISDGDDLNRTSLLLVFPVCARGNREEGS